MDNFNTETTPTKIVTAHGEIIYELIGRTLGRKTNLHSVAQVVLPPQKSSLRHYHPQAEESYYVVQGTARMEIDNEVATLFPGDAVLIPAPSAHKIYNVGKDDLVLIVVCVPAWEASNTIWLEEVSREAE
jgi:mannose-6-phosphate isomerase-like protein (cupin superfamily)